MVLQTVSISIQGALSFAQSVDVDAVAALPLFGKLKLVLQGAPRRPGLLAEPPPSEFLNRVIHGDCMTVIKSLPSETVDCVITSPPYFALRDYGVAGQIGLEQTPDVYTEKLVELFREVRRVLKTEGTLWLNLGDSYAAGGNGGQGAKQESNRGTRAIAGKPRKAPAGLKPKDLIGIPWRVALALQADGWYLRQDIIWSKPNPMPESVTDRCTRAHEYIFLLAKSRKYFFDADAIREPLGEDQREAGLIRARKYGYDGKGTYQDWYNNQRKGRDWVNKKVTGDHLTFGQAVKLAGAKPPSLPHPLGKNKRSVWTIAPRPFLGAHFATFPETLIEPMLRAGCPRGGLVLDPFMGAGTTAVVAKRLERNYLGIELNHEYIRIAEQRLVAAGL